MNGWLLHSLWNCQGYRATLSYIGEESVLVSLAPERLPLGRGFVAREKYELII